MKIKRSAIILLGMAAFVAFSGCTTEEELYCDKPVVYLYPEETTDIQVCLNLDGELTCTYPTYDNGWNVTAEPDGTLTNHTDGKEYSYLYWEGVVQTAWDMSEGFVVKGEDTAEFLQKTLSEIGLTPREYNEFIVYWLPQMQDNPYNLITFQQEAYTDAAQLNITPEPDVCCAFSWRIRRWKSLSRWKNRKSNRSRGRASPWWNGAVRRCMKMHDGGIAI